MKTFSLYEPSTGLFTGETRSGSRPDFVLKMIPAGLAAIEGHFDHRRQRVDLASGEVIDDPALAEVNRERSERRAHRAFALDQIAELERKQLRPIRELQIDPTNEQARARVAEIEAQIAELRAAL